jgi:hypothetical protein
MTGDRECLYADQAVALALHALEPADEDALTQHVPQCLSCQELVRQTQEVVWGLAAEAEQVDPPARLRESLMAEVATTEQLPPEQREQPWSTGEPARPSVPEARTLSGSTSHRALDAPRSVSASSFITGSPRRRLLAVLATVAVALAGVGGVTFELVQRAEHEERAALVAPSPEVTRILADLDRSGARHAVLHSPDGQVAAAVAQFPDTRKVMPLRLAANPPRDTVYVLWGLGDGPARALGTFDVTAPSETMLTVGAPSASVQFASYAISIENGRTAPVSPGLVVASGQVAG